MSQFDALDNFTEKPKVKKKPSPKKPKKTTSSPPPEDEKKEKIKTGKSSSKKYKKVMIYIEKETHQKAKIELLKKGSEMDFSDLCQDLLLKWIKSKS